MLIKRRAGLRDRGAPDRTIAVKTAVSDSPSRSPPRVEHRDIRSIRIRNCGAERGSRTPTCLRTTLFEFDYAAYAVVHWGSPVFKMAHTGESSVRHRTPKFALTAVKLLSGRTP